MLSELNIQLTEIREKLLRRKKLEKDLSTIKSQIDFEETNKKSLSIILDKELADVEKLEELSLTSLFHSILGSKKNQLEKERQEYLRAKLNYEECNEGLEVLRADSRKLQNEIDKFGNLEDEYQIIFKQKEAVILNENDETTAKLFDLSEQFLAKDARLRELKEAMEAGESVLSAIRKILTSLNSAKDWGTLDMIGGGMISTAVKHSHINDSQMYINQAQQAVRRLERELKDVEIQVNISAEIGDFLTFADYLFDSLITDWLVQDKIKTSINRTLQLQKVINNIIRDLKNTSFELKKEQKTITETRLSLIEKAN